MATLDVSRIFKLRSVDCADNLLTTLSVTDKPALTKLICSYNSLTALDISGCDELAYLECEGNELASEADIVGLDKSTLLHYRFSPQNSVASQAPLASALAAAVAAAPPLARRNGLYSHANIAAGLGPGPFSLNDLIERYGEPEEVSWRIVGNIYGDFGIVTRFSGISFELVTNLSKMSSFGDSRDVDSLTTYRDWTEDDKALGLYPHRTIISDPWIVLPGGVHIGMSKTAVIQAYDGDGGKDMIGGNRLVYLRAPYLEGVEHDGNADNFATARITYWFDKYDRLGEIVVGWNDSFFGTD
jgi:hypothetical protein